MKIDISWKGQSAFEAQTPSGHTYLLDTGKDHGGENSGPRPTEILLSAVGVCSGIDVVDIVKKMRFKLEDFSIEVSGERAEDHPKKFTNVHICYDVKGDIPEEKISRAISLSLEKYCSVSHSLQAEITASVFLNGEKFAVPF